MTDAGRVGPNKRNLPAMAELERRTPPFAGLVRWSVLVASAFLAADLVSASLERHLQAPPRLDSIQAAPEPRLHPAR